jgi:hypothetical protein
MTLYSLIFPNELRTAVELSPPEKLKKSILQRKKLKNITKT